MMILRYAPASPYARKVRIAADLLGLSDRIEVVTADTTNPGDPLRDEAPLGKIPALTVAPGETFFDSRVIVAYLDDLAGGGRIVPTGRTRFEALRHEALADGLLDAALLQVYEVRFRPPEGRNQNWVDHQAGKVSRTLDHCEANLAEPAPEIHVGHIAQACALGYLDLRFSGEWRTNHPRLVAWLDDFASRVPAFEATRPT
jgi:glutathione S-transferase